MALVKVGNIRGRQGEKGDKGDQGIVPPSIDKRLDAMEEIAAEPGTRYENHVIDPMPATTVDTYSPNNVSLQQATSVWGRAVYNGSTAAVVTARGGFGAGEDSKAIVHPGDKVAGRVTIRAMDGQRMSATLQIHGWEWDGTSFTNKTELATSGQLHIDPGNDNQKTFEAFGQVPSNTNLTHFEMSFTFRRYGQTYPSAGDFVYFRQVALYSGANAVSPVPYYDGNSSGAFWVDKPNKSPSIRMSPRGAGGGGGAGGGLQRATVVDAGIKRRGGRIGTNGKAAIALRFDHHFAPFNSKVMPLLRTNRMPWGQMTNIGNFGKGNDTLTVAQVADLCYTSGGELWNHSLTHSDIPDAATADREVTKGLSDLKNAFPQLWIDGWAGPGQTNLMGMEGSDTPEKFYGTYPGQLVLRQHAFVRGYYPGIYQSMSEPNLVGAPHTTIDTLDYAYVKGIIDGAISAGAGLTLMLHPNYLDTAGYMTTATLKQIIEYVAQKRDAGEAVILSPTGVLLADSSSDDRRNLLISGAAKTLNGTWSETVSGRSAQNQYGVPHELVVTVRARAAGTVTLTLSETGTNRRFNETHTVSVISGQFVTLRCLATFPINTAGIAVSLTGNVDHSEMKLHAV